METESPSVNMKDKMVKTLSCKRILFVCGVFYPEPVVSARLQTDLARKLAEKYSVTVLRPRPTRPKGFSFPDYDYSTLPFEVIEMDSYTCPSSSLSGRFRESFSHGRWCARYIRQHHDTIDFIYNDSWHLFGVYLVAKVANKYGIPYITPVQDVYPESLASKLPDIKPLKWLVMRLLSPWDHYVLFNAAFVQTNSEKMANYLSESRCLDRNKFVVVRNWQDEKPFVDYAKKGKGQSVSAPFTFMYLGNVGPLAGIELLFEAFAEADLKDARLVIAGSGPAKADLQKQSRKYSCKIEFWDVPTGKVPETQAKSDVMLLPVKKGYAKFSVPSKLVAYMFSAKPIIASVDADSDTADSVERSGAGWVVEPDNVQRIASVMRYAFQCPQDLLDEKGKRGYTFSIHDFSMNKNLLLLVRACETAINKK